MEVWLIVKGALAAILAFFQSKKKSEGDEKAEEFNEAVKDAKEKRDPTKLNNLF